MAKILSLCAAMLLGAIQAASAATVYGGIQQTTVNCTTSSGPLLADGAARSFIYLKIPNRATATVWINWTGAAAVTQPPSEDMAPGANKTWTVMSGFLPSGPVTCISEAGTVAVTLEYQ